jgi:hypothetical protein
MVHGLFGSQLGHWGDDACRVASEENHVLGVTTDGGYRNVFDMFKGVAHTGVLGQTGVEVINGTGFVLIVVVLNVFNKSAKFNSIVNVGFFFARETIALGVAASLDIENIGVSPDVLIITDQGTFGVT